ncbi:MAG: iron complex outerrane recepter protein [Gammaproteobacteria bacterium]|jgi:iron complex outermembrane receptor protein|nr:iron complex outerrane recepter protein [Gammaproteobacteria bacterium]
MNYSYIPLRFLGFFLACGAATLQSIPACAQNAGALEGQGLEEIVVTATRRETDLEKTPISISVLGSAAIEKNHVVDLTDVTRLTPSLVYMPRGGSEGYLSLRGAIIFDDSPGTDPAVSTYIDDIVRVSVADVQPDVYDLDRVEVLKGPQGTLFGRNSIGGVVSMYTNQPTFKNGGTAEVTYGAHNLVELKGLYNAALIDDKLAGRIIVSDTSVSGNVRDITTGGELNGGHQLSVRGKLLFTPIEDFKSVSSFDYLRKSGTQAEWLLGNFQPALVPGMTYDPEQSAQGRPGEYAQTNWGLTERADWTMGVGTLTSITGYRHLDANNTKTLYPVDALILNAAEHDNQITQELRLASPVDQPLTWIVGMYYLHNKKERPVNALQDYLAGSVFAHKAAGFPPPILYQNIQVAHTTSAAPFADVAYNLTGKLKLDLGARYTWQEKSGSAYLNSTGGVIRGANISAAQNASWNAFTPAVTLSYQATSALMSYATVSRGFLSGGFNANSSTSKGLATPFDSEYVWNYEVGVKFNGLDNRLRANIAAFVDKYTNLQVIQYNPNTLDVVTTNAGAARVGGVETELQGAPVRWLTLGVQYDYLDSRFTQFLINNGDGTFTNDAGHKVPFTPTHRVTASVEAHSDFSIGTIAVGGDYTYRSTQEFTAENDTPQQIRSLTAWRGLVNLHALWTSRDDRWEVLLWGKNVTNLHYAVFAQSAEVFIANGAEFFDPSKYLYEIQPGPYRSYGVTLRTRF